MLLTFMLLAASSPVGCQPVAGFAEAIAESRARWIVAGEMHGTNEMPAAFANLVCLASLSAPVVVAVEQPEQDQAAIDAYLNSDGGEEAEANFLCAMMWRVGQPDNILDGRSSQAMFKLFQNLWKQHRRGTVVRVIAFQPGLEIKDGTFRMPWLDYKPINHAEYEKRMAALLQFSASKTRMIVLTGSAHARFIPMDGFPDLKPMASFLPRGETLTLHMTSYGTGSAWNCLEDGCGVHEVKGGLQRQLGVVIEKKPGQPYSGSLSLGIPVSASLPQRVPIRPAM